MGRDKEWLEEQIQSHIDYWWQQTEFAKDLLEILRRASTVEAFKSEAMLEAKGLHDPWIRDELCSFVENLEYC